jgi:Rieske Fe-S protein
MIENRRKFIRKTCILCAGLSTPAFIISGCQVTHYTSGSFHGEDLLLPVSEFNYEKKGRVQKRSFIIIQNEKLEFPIYVYRFSDSQYSALWMKCAHQGAELQASGDHLYCPSHGSEYNNLGEVKQGPAETNLRTFPVTVQGDSIVIKLRKA